MAKGKELVKINMEEDANNGLENMTKDDLVIPFFKITQPLTPEVVEGQVKPGVIMNTATGEVYEKGLEIIPCAYEKQFLEWTPRESGGGLVNVHNAIEGQKLLSTCSKNDKGKDVLGNGNLLVPTAVHYVCAWTGTPVLGIMSMSSTALKKSRKWNSVASSIRLQGKNGPYTPPMFGHKYKVNVCQESNNFGTWFNWDISLDGSVDDENLYLACKKFAQDMKTGSINVKHEGEAPPF